jgi:predicted ribosome quality control (RQC) complex YloA/Tae2 family protein
LRGKDRLKARWFFMAFLVAHAEKFSIGACAGLGIHVDRKSEEHSNKNIDNTLSSENVQLVENYNNNLYGAVKDRIREVYTGKKAIRKDAVATVGVVCSASSEFFENKSKAESVQYFKDCKEFFENKVGKENIVCAKIHFDEKTPHMHLYFVPLTSDGRLSAKEVCNREFLRDMQRELPLYLQEKGHDVERGLEDSTNEHISKKKYEINLQRAEIDKQIQKILEEEKKLKEKKEKLTLEEEKLYNLEQLMENVQERKSLLYKDKITVSMDKEIYKSFLNYAREGYEYLKHAVNTEKKFESYEKVMIERKNELEKKCVFLEKENEKLKNKKSELEKKLEKFDELEKLEKWIPGELKEKFKQEQEEEKAKKLNKGRIIKTWKEKEEEIKGWKTRGRGGIER